MDSRQIFAPSGPGNEPEELDGASQAQVFTQSFDDPLNKIDFIPETNAKAFVQGFAQKGGQ